VIGTTAVHLAQGGKPAVLNQREVVGAIAEEMGDGAPVRRRRHGHGVMKLQTMDAEPTKAGTALKYGEGRIVTEVSRGRVATLPVT